MNERPPALDPALVQQFVIAGHGDLEKTRALLEQEPGLLNATWDWGGGDFESAIGGAGHMGNRENALFLIDKGARYDIFVAAMLGELEYVTAALAIHPLLIHSKGPHGIPLLAHATAGGELARDVAAYIESLLSV